MRLLARLTEAQEKHGYLSEPVLRELAQSERVPLYRLQELVSFYPHFRTSPPARVEIAVCRDMSCWLANGPAHCARLQQQLAGRAEVHIHEASCLGRCEMAPAALINEKPVTLSASSAFRSWVEEPDAIPELPSGRLRDPARPEGSWRCDPYPEKGQRFGLFRVLLQHPASAERILAALKESGLRGRGGAGFPAAAKWELVRKQERTPKYVICNADESEPGTFKDRVLLAELSHLVIEGMLLAMLTTGAERGILFIRHEYGPERRAFEQALQEIRQDDYPIDIVVSPGGYILGEETALLEALEDKRGEPRNKPPFPGTHGLHGRPTLINNVETLVMVPAIVGRGPQWWKDQGKPEFAGLKVMAVSGHVERPGVYEVAVGTPVRELIELAGGMKDGRPLLAFAPGGASSPFLPASQIDVPLDFDPLTKAGSMLGSGALVVVAEGTDMLALATNVVRFFRNESCGKCVPCRVGSQKAVELLERVGSGQAEAQELQILPELGETLLLTSICGLGQVALNPILSVMKHWPDASTKRR